MSCPPAFVAAQAGAYTGTANTFTSDIVWSDQIKTCATDVDDEYCDECDDAGTYEDEGRWWYCTCEAGKELELLDRYDDATELALYYRQLQHGRETA